MSKIQNFFLAADHAGFYLKEKLKKFFASQAINFTDLGTNSSKSVDYPDFAHALAKKISTTPNSTGVLICGSGIGVSIAANRHHGVRAARCCSELDATLARQHNNANVLALAGRQLTFFQAKKIVKKFLTIKFEEGRHKRRVEKIEIK
jgi:ribose 5-phosphate isomerase B